MTLEELIARRDKLRGKRFGGVLTVRMDGEEVTYKSDASMAAALAAIEAEILKLQRGPRPRTSYPKTTKGMT